MVLSKSSSTITNRIGGFKHTWFIPKVSVLIFLFIYWTYLKLQVITFEVWPLEIYTAVPTFLPLIIAVPEVIFHKCVYLIGYSFPSSWNVDPSTSNQGRGRNRTELDLGCKEVVEVRKCFSSPEILELKVQCELARYRGAAPNRLQCPNLLDPFSKSFQDIFVKGVINCQSWRYKFLVHNATAVEKKQ